MSDYVTIMFCEYMIAAPPSECNKPLPAITLRGNDSKWVINEVLMVFYIHDIGECLFKTPWAAVGQLSLPARCLSLAFSCLRDLMTFF